MKEPSKNPFTLAHLAGVVVMILFFGWIAGPMGGGSNPTPQDAGPKMVSKTEWREKLRPYWNPGGPIKVTTVANFKVLTGEPSQTQTDGDTGHAYEPRNLTERFINEVRNMQSKTAPIFLPYVP